jgi:hypothetical protein
LTASARAAISLIPTRERRERPPQEPDHTEGGLASMDARMAAREVAGPELPALDPQKASGERAIDRLDLAK